MKANIRIKSLKCDENILSILAKLERIKGLTGISVDKESSRVSFNYETEETALAVIEKLKLLSCSPCTAGRSESCRTSEI